jgi:ABC-type branched-subunit amino acid transport system substrate-binding protein
MALVLAVAAAVHPSRALAQAAADTLRVGLVVQDSAARTGEAASAARGVRMGMEEAARSASLFGRAVSLAEGADADRLVSESRVQALLGGFSEDECRALGELAARRGVIFVDLGCGADALRGSDCRRTTFHVTPSAAMLGDAARLAGVADGQVEAWNERLDRFGADQLNQRYRARFGQGMDGAAWAGWFAVKALWESSLRARSSSAEAVMGWLESPATQFDGHKGRPLSFRAWDHQLRQPLYVTSASGGEPVEVPRATPGADESSRDILDRLGTPRERSTCKMGA